MILDFRFVIFDLEFEAWYLEFSHYELRMGELRITNGLRMDYEWANYEYQALDIPISSNISVKLYFSVYLCVIPIRYL